MRISQSIRTTKLNHGLQHCIKSFCKSSRITRIQVPTPLHSEYKYITNLFTSMQRKKWILYTKHYQTLSNHEGHFLCFLTLCFSFLPSHFNSRSRTQG